MTREDIIRMAREADIDWHRHWNDDETNRLEIFAQLVAAAALKTPQISKCPYCSSEWVTGQQHDHNLQVYLDAIAAEREACAKVADEWIKAYPHPSERIAEMIRARDKT